MMLILEYCNVIVYLEGTIYSFCRFKYSARIDRNVLCIVYMQTNVID